MMMKVKTVNPLLLFKSAVIVILIWAVIYPKDAFSKPPFIGMLQARMQIQDTSITLIGIISSFKKKQACKNTTNGFVQALIKDIKRNAKEGLSGKVDAVFCAQDAPQKSIWDALIYKNSFSHFVLEVENNMRLMIISNDIRMEEGYCELLLNQFVTGRGAKGRCIFPTK
jgi:hypothetical protein